MFKKTILIMCSILVTTILYMGTISAYTEDFPYTPETTQGDDITQKLSDAATNTQGPIQQLISVFLPSRPTGEGAVSYIVYIVNIALSIVAFIALIVLIIGFYGIIFRNTQDGISNAKKTVKGALLAIVIIGASWIITQAMFYVIGLLQ